MLGASWLKPCAQTHQGLVPYSFVWWGVRPIQLIAKSSCYQSSTGFIFQQAVVSAAQIWLGVSCLCIRYSAEAARRLPERPTFASRGQDYHSMSLKGPYPQVLTFLGGATFIAWQLTCHFLREFWRGQRQFSECRGRLGYGPKPGFNLKCLMPYTPVCMG